jgi:hypothetical protein
MAFDVLSAETREMPPRISSSAATMIRFIQSI